MATNQTVSSCMLAFRAAMGNLTQNQRTLLNVFFDPEKAGSFTNPQTLRKVLLNKPRKHRGRPVQVPKLKQINEFLQSKRAYTLHRPARKRYPMKKVIVGGVNIQLQIDLVDMTQWARDNDNYRYILLAIDCFSRFAYAQPLKTKHGETVAKALETILNQAEKRIDRKIKRIQADQGLEFYNKHVKAMLKERDVHLFSTKSPTKAQMVERLIRTLRGRQERINTYRGQRRWIDSFFKLVKSYNKTPHSSLPNDMNPSDVSVKNESQVWHHLYGKTLLTTPPHLVKKLRARKRGVDVKHLRDLNVGDAVRLSKRKRTFEKAYYQNWTDEVFFVARISQSTTPTTYRIKDSDGELLEGVFYRQELTPVRLDSDIYAVEKVLEQETRPDGKSYFLVKWRGYPDSHNSWIRADEVRAIAKAS